MNQGTTGSEFSGYGQPRSLGMSVQKTDDDRKAVLNTCNLISKSRIITMIIEYFFMLKWIHNAFKHRVVHGMKMDGPQK